MFRSIVTTFSGGVPFALTGTRTKNDLVFNKQTFGDEKSATDKQINDKQTLLSVFEINIIRYSLALEDTRPEDLDPFFLIDFMSLPDNYFLGDAPQKYGILKFFFH